ncbi:MAG: cellulase family glycosylhydrolase [Dehalococcoidales bacterium]|nr:cellulase family glycosylhydrolase [Dehalococcoidales bacterium]
MRRLALLVVLTLLLPLFSSAPPPALAEQGFVRAEGARLVNADGSTYFMLGANYVGAPDRSWTMWEDGLFDAGLIETDLRRVQAAGLNTVRIFVRPPLQDQILAGQWGKLDTVISLAEGLGLRVILTLYDYRQDELAKVAEVDGAIARRYADRSAILAYDLKNEPHFQDLAIAQYPGSPPPLQTDVLIKQYGQRVSLEAAAAWRRDGSGKSLIPARFTAEQAYIYANNYRYYTEFVRESGDWITAHNYEVTTLDYLAAPEAAKWRPYIDALSQTLAAWLQPQLEAIRAADSRHLVTVGYSDSTLAALTANNALSFMSVHRFPNKGIKALNGIFDLLDDVRRAFPDKPVTLEEYGYANSDVPADEAALHETAIALHLLNAGLAGGAKWSLNDVANGWNPRENSYGLYGADGGAKAVVYALRALQQHTGGSAPAGGDLNIEAVGGNPGVRYTYTAPRALFLGGDSFGSANGGLSFTSSGVAQIFASWPREGEIDLTATAPATLRVDPAALAGASGVRVLSLARANGAAVPFQNDGNAVVFGVEAGESYVLRYASTSLDARIEIVWPHDGLPVSQATLANIGAYLFQRDVATTVCPQFTPTVRLWRALNNGVEEEVATGTQMVKQENGLTFPAWEFNDVDVRGANDPANKLYFRLSVDGYPYRTSIWSHAEDARTYLPQQDVPTGVATQAPAAVNAKIQIVWPHDGLPVTEATKANIGVNLYVRDTLETVPLGWSPTVRLWRALNNGYAEEVAIGRLVVKEANGLTYPTWEFNDVDVSAARDPLNKYYFRVTVDGVDSRSSVWSHGADARTYFPRQDVPEAVQPCN